MNDATNANAYGGNDYAGNDYAGNDYAGQEYGADDGGIADSLRALVAKGFQFVHPRDSAGSVVAITGVRAHHRVVDVVQIYGETDVDAVRIPGDEVDILFPRTVLWRNSGRASDVINSVLNLPDPEPDSDTSSGRNGCWVQTKPGWSTWLAATS
jgi:hypothetical protein